MWHLNDQPFEPDEEFLKQYHGFVYEITELATGKKYIGKKGFWSTRRLPPLNGKTRIRLTTTESDGRHYHGCSEKVKRLGDDGCPFRRDILCLCKTKGEFSYYEAKLQFVNDVLV